MTSTEDMQDWLALEHEAVWLYPVIGARFKDLADRARTSYDEHRDVRDRLLLRLHEMDVEPVSTALSYDVGRLRTKARARGGARRRRTRHRGGVPDPHRRQHRRAPGVRDGRAAPRGAGRARVGRAQARPPSPASR